MDMNIECKTEAYTGLEALFYDLLRGQAPEEEIHFYQKMLQEKKGLALELGCGTGRLLLPLIQAGLNIEGIDYSEEMLKICQKLAQKKKLSPKLYPGKMQDFHLEKKYDSIFIEGGTFMLLTDRAEAFAALKNCYDHLKPQGQLIIELFLPLNDIKKCDNSSWNLQKTAVNPEDKALVFYSESSTCNVLEQLKTGWSKYEVFKNGHLIQSQLCISQLRWYSQYEFLLMLEKTGFKNIEIMNKQLREGLDEENTLIFRAFR